MLIAAPQTPPAAEPLEINDHDLDRALLAGLHCMANITNPDDRHIPYFECFVLGRPTMLFNSQLSVGNVTGRCLYAMLKAEAELGIEVDPVVIARYRQVLIDSYSVVRAIPANPNYPGGPYQTCWIFNDGAGLRGLMALVNYRDDALAREILDDTVTNYKLYWQDQGYSWEAFRAHFNLTGGGYGGANPWPGAGIINARRSYFRIEPWLKYHLVQGAPAAFALASSLGNIMLSYNFPASGALVGYDHMFEPVAEMNNMALLATITNNAAMMNRVRARYDNGVRAVISAETGWVPERLSSQSDVGEINNSGEVIETALKLGDWGWPQYYEDAERYTRAHLLPAQLLDISFILPSTENPPSDGLRMVRERVQGAYGFPAPYGHISTRNPYFDGGFFMDIVAGGVATVAEVRRHCTRYSNGAHTVNLLFDYQNEHIAVSSPYPDGGPLVVTLFSPGTLRVRLASWLDREQLRVQSQGAALAFTTDEHYLTIANPPLFEPIEIHYPLAVRRTTEVLNGRELTYHWRGDSIAAMTQMGTSLPFFPEYDPFNYWLDTLGPDRLMLRDALDGAPAPDPGAVLMAENLAPAVNRRDEPAGALAFNGMNSALVYSSPYFTRDACSFMAWVRVEGADAKAEGPRHLFSAWAAAHDDPLRVTVEGNQIYAAVEAGQVHATRAAPLPPGPWFHVAVVKEGAALILYLNGEPAAAGDIPTGAESAATNFALGFLPEGAGSGHFHGALDDCTLHARALTADEVLKMYRASAVTAAREWVSYR
ncbi:MAG TPA: LamG domain-containing protein [Candidatus Sumerlaeota bacterium]|nr:LamG domain-containing protein [Candidatus Sumerlaeota bacterium]